MALTPQILKQRRFGGFKILEYYLQDLMLDLPPAGLIKRRDMIPKGEAFEGAFEVTLLTHLEWYNGLTQPVQLRVLYTLYVQAVQKFLKEFKEHIAKEYKAGLLALKYQNLESVKKINDLMNGLDEETFADTTNTDLPLIPCSIMEEWQTVIKDEIIPS